MTFGVQLPGTMELDACEAFQGARAVPLHECIPVLDKRICILLEPRLANCIVVLLYQSLHLVAEEPEVLQADDEVGRCEVHHVLDHFLASGLLSVQRGDFINIDCAVLLLLLAEVEPHFLNFSHAMMRIGDAVLKGTLKLLLST